jgi:hypothetical protein
VRTDGFPFADRVDDLVAGKIYAPLRLNERGEDVGTTGAEVASGTGSDGTLYSGHNCSDYTDAGGLILWGLASGTTEQWTAANAPDECNIALRLYCFGTSSSQPVPAPRPMSGRFAFVSVANFSGGGIASADAACGIEASAAGLPGSYLALLATTTASAGSRFSLTGPAWVRVDGGPLAESALAFMSGNFRNGLSQTANGRYVALYILTGTGPGGLLSQAATMAETCNDWTTTSGTSVVGHSGRSDAALYYYGPGNCIRPFYCLQQ